MLPQLRGVRSELEFIHSSLGRQEEDDKIFLREPSAYTVKTQAITDDTTSNVSNALTNDQTRS